VNRTLVPGAMRRESGVALFMVLIGLIVLGLLAANNLQSALLADRTARLADDRLVAMQAAEAALRDAERDLEGRRADGTPCSAGATGCRPVGERPLQGPGGAGLAYFTASCGSTASKGQCLRAETDWYPQPPWRDPNLATRAARYGEYTGGAALPGLARQPTYFVEGFRRASAYVFRITASAEGALPGTRVVVQSVYQLGE